MSFVSCWLFLARRSISSEMSTAESSCTKRSSSIFCCSSAIGCSKSRKVCFKLVFPARCALPSEFALGAALRAHAGRILRSGPRQRLDYPGTTAAPCGEHLVGEYGRQHQCAPHQRLRPGVLAHEHPDPDRTEDGLQQREQPELRRGERT